MLAYTGADIVMSMPMCGSKCTVAVHAGIIVDAQSVHETDTRKLIPHTYRCV